MNSSVCVLKPIALSVSICIHTRAHAHTQCNLKFNFHGISLYFFFFHLTYRGDLSLSVYRVLTSSFLLLHRILLYDYTMINVLFFCYCKQASVRILYAQVSIFLCDRSLDVKEQSQRHESYCRITFHKGYIRICSHTQCTRIPVFPHPHHSWIFSNFLISRYQWIKKRTFFFSFHFPEY